MTLLSIGSLAKVHLNGKRKTESFFTATFIDNRWTVNCTLKDPRNFEPVLNGAVVLVLGYQTIETGLASRNDRTIILIDRKIAAIPTEYLSPLA